MELNDFFPVDANLSMVENLSQLPAELNNGSIFSWKYGLYTKKILEELKSSLNQYGFDHEINNVKSPAKHLIFTKAFPELFDLVLNKKEDQHIYLFLTEKEIEENSFLKGFFYLNEEINYTLLASCFIEDGTWSDVEKWEHPIGKSLVKFKELQKKHKLNPSFLFEIKDEDSAEFVWRRVFNE